MIVVRDLRDGCLSSLDLYLRIHQGIPDREVALELRKLIAGSQQRSKFRLFVLPHPDTKIKKGPRRKSRVAKPRKDQFELADAFDVAKGTHDFADAAIAKVLETKKASATGIYRAAQKVAAYRSFIEEQKAERAARTQRLNETLATQRQKSRE